MGCLWRHGGKAELLVAVVKHRVVLADEDVAKNPQRTTGRGDVNARHAEQTDCVLVVDDVVGRLDNIHLQTTRTPQR